MHIVLYTSDEIKIPKYRRRQIGISGRRGIVSDTANREARPYYHSMIDLRHLFVLSFYALALPAAALDDGAHAEAAQLLETQMQLEAAPVWSCRAMDS